MTERKEYQQTLDGFYDYLSGILKCYQEAIPVLREELNAIEEDRIEDLNNSLKSQQALLLQTRGFDGTVSDYLSSLSMSATNLSEMIVQLPEEERLRFSEILGQFGLAIKEVDFYKEKCRTLLQSKLHVIDKRLARQAHAQDHTIYNENADQIHDDRTSKTFEKKV